MFPYKMNTATFHLSCGFEFPLGLFHIECIQQESVLYSECHT